MDELQCSLHRMVLSASRAARCLNSLPEQACLLARCRAALAAFAHALGRVKDVDVSDEGQMGGLFAACRSAALELASLMNVLRSIHVT